MHNAAVHTMAVAEALMKLEKTMRLIDYVYQSLFYDKYFLKLR